MGALAVFERTDALGRFSVRPVDPAADAEQLHAWLTHPKSRFWLMLDADVAAVEREYRRIAESPTQDAFIGLHDDRPAFLAELYDPAHDEVGEAYPVQRGDVGMHFLVAPTGTPLHGFTRAVIRTVMELAFSDPDARRVVVEPDVRNRAVHALNAAVGFDVVGTVRLRHKRALLSTCTREQFAQATGR